VVPLRDDNPVRITPYITYGLIVMNIAAFIYELTLAGPALEGFFDHWAVVPDELTLSFQTQSAALQIAEWPTLITSQFLHGGFLHIAGNMLYLWIFGNNVEDQLGHGKYLFFYLACGVLAGLAQWLVDPASTVPSLGASGAIAGVMGAYIFRFPKVKILTIVPLGVFLAPVQIPAILFLGFWFLEQALYGILSLEAQTNIGMDGGIAYWAHAGGFLFGAILGWLLGLFSAKEAETIV
jgi:membrane associated rhomboid family serine protease